MTDDDNTQNPTQGTDMNSPQTTEPITEVNASGEDNQTGPNSEPVEYVASVKGVDKVFDHAITLQDLIDFTEEQGVKKFSAYAPETAEFPNGQKLKARMFPYAGDVELRELMEPKTFN